MSKICTFEVLSQQFSWIEEKPLQSELHTRLGTVSDKKFFQIFVRHCCLLETKYREIRISGDCTYLGMDTNRAHS